jgi:hypothetical protein
MTNSNIFNSSLSGNDQSDNEVDIESVKTRFLKEDGSIDVDGLLKAKAHADKHIKNLEIENTGMRDDLKTRQTLEELLAKTQSQPNLNVNAEPPVNSNNQNPLSDTDLEAKLNAKLSEWEKKKAREQNAAYVRSELSKAWGSDYLSKLEAKSRELGESLDDLAEMAQNKPKVFLKLVGAEGERSVFNPAPPSSQFRSNAQNSQQNTKTYSWFQNLRRSDPSTYWSVATQKELHRIAEEYAARGEDFTKT